MYNFRSISYLNNHRCNHMLKLFGLFLGSQYSLLSYFKPFICSMTFILCTSYLKKQRKKLCISFKWRASFLFQLYYCSNVFVICIHVVNAVLLLFCSFYLFIYRVRSRNRKHQFTLKNNVCI